MAMNTNYHDRGMKKWQPFFSSPHLKASVLANREEVLAPYQAPEVMTESQIDAELQRAFQERLRVKVTLNVQVAERHAYYMGQVIGRADQFVLIDNSPVEYETIRHVQVYEPTKWWDHA